MIPLGAQALRAPPPPGPALRAVGLVKHFPAPGGGRVEAVRRADLEVGPGEVVLILGPSGSGKTTLLSLLAGILAPGAGTVHLCGEEVHARGEAELPAFRLRHVGFVFQSFRLLDALTAAENVELPLNLAGKRRPDSSERARVLLEEVGLAHRSGFFPDALSGGEKQRVAVARALALEPPVLLADEPTASLDSIAGEQVAKALCEAARRRGSALLMVGHDVRLVAWADRVLSMEDGLLADRA